jgi:hypothetical protein
MQDRERHRVLKDLSGCLTPAGFGLVAGLLSMVWIFGMPAAYGQIAPAGSVLHRNMHVHLRRHLHVHKHRHVDRRFQTDASGGSAAGGSTGLSANDPPPQISFDPPSTGDVPAGGGSDPLLMRTASGNDGVPLLLGGSNLSLGDPPAGDPPAGDPPAGDPPAPVPEPASLAVFGSALALLFGLGAAPRRRG